MPVAERVIVGKRDGDEEGYVAKNAICATCGGVIVQWRNAEPASFHHADTQLFKCPDKFQEFIHASPAKDSIF